MKPITDLNTDRMTCLVIGRPGIGKTTLVGTVPEGEKACILSAESGLLCLRDLLKSKTVDAFSIETFEDLQNAYMDLMTPEYQEQYKWVFVDSLTEISDLCVKMMDREFPNPKDALKKWGMFTMRMTNLIKAFRDMPHYNVVFTCLESVEKDEMNRRYISPEMAGKKLKEKLPSLFDEVFHMLILEQEENEPRRVLVTDAIDECPGKDRSGKLETYEEPDLSIISNKIFNNGE